MFQFLLTRIDFGASGAAIEGVAPPPKGAAAMGFHEVMEAAAKALSHAGRQGHEMLDTRPANTANAAEPEPESLDPDTDADLLSLTDDTRSYESLFEEEAPDVAVSRSSEDDPDRDASEAAQPDAVITAKDQSPPEPAPAPPLGPLTETAARTAPVARDESKAQDQSPRGPAPASPLGPLTESAVRTAPVARDESKAKDQSPPEPAPAPPLASPTETAARTAPISPDENKPLEASGLVPIAAALRSSAGPAEASVTDRRRAGPARTHAQDPDAGLRLRSLPGSVPRPEMQMVATSAVRLFLETRATAEPQIDAELPPGAAAISQANVPAPTDIQRLLSVDSPQAPRLGAAVQAQITAALTNTASTNFEIRLAPEELGKVRIILQPSDAGLQVSILAERPETLELLRRFSADLLQELSELGYSELNLQFNGQDERQQAATGSGGLHTTATGQDDDAAPALRPTIAMQGDGMDIRL